MTKFEIYDKIKDLPVSSLLVETTGERRTFVVFTDRYTSLTKGVWNETLNTDIDKVLYLFNYLSTGNINVVPLNTVVFGRDFIPAPKKKRELLYCVRRNNWTVTDRVRVYSDGFCENIDADGTRHDSSWTKDWVEDRVLKLSGAVKCDDSPRYVYPLTEAKVVDVKHLVREGIFKPTGCSGIITLEKFLYLYAYHVNDKKTITERFKESGATHVSL